MNQSESLFARAQRHIPGGVNSPVRAFRAVGGDPLFFQRGEGAYLIDADDRHYIDYVGSWGPMIAGHAHPEVVRAVQDAAARGLGIQRKLDIVVDDHANALPEVTTVPAARCRRPSPRFWGTAWTPSRQSVRPSTTPWRV